MPSSSSLYMKIKPTKSISKHNWSMKQCEKYQKDYVSVENSSLGG
jgi:hypothetical protein